ncbi:MAG: hypothetical protein MHPSP_004336, partial [Paramarteilia canceri]
NYEGSKLEWLIEKSFSKSLDPDHFTLIEQLPKILIVIIKRFSFVGENPVKKHNRVKFNENLIIPFTSMTNKIPEKNRMYGLFASNF